MSRQSPPSVYDVRIEHHRVPFGIGESRPRISWSVAAEQAAWLQHSYEIQVVDTGSGSVVTSGRVESPEQVLVPWPTEALQSRDRRTLRVRVWGPSGDASDWSAPVELEAGLLDATEWSAQLIVSGESGQVLPYQPATRFRREFDVPSEAQLARLYVTAQGLYEVELDGVPIGDVVLAPGWTSYRDRLRYQTFDVGELLQQGRHAIGVTVADGWFRGLLGFRGGRRAVYGRSHGLLLQLEWTSVDGSVHRLVSNARWRASNTGPVRSAGIYEGETYDARLRNDGWTKTHFIDSSWQPVRTEPIDHAILVAPSGPPVRRIEELEPVATASSPSGAALVDFGQNMVGRLRIKPPAAPGAMLSLRHAEVLQDGELYTRPLRGAAATDHYIAGEGRADESWEPRFTFHGFRYAEINGWPTELDPSDVRAVVIHSDMERAGWFACSNPDLERLHENAVWSMRGNFVDLPTDCPQRDERFGWTGDIQVFAPSAAFLYRCAGFLTSWLRDLACEQRRLGTVPQFVPFVELDDPALPFAGWGDAAVIVPWVLYERYADRGILEDQFASMAGWVDQVASLCSASGRWETGRQLGDWLDPAAPPESPGEARTDPYLIATAYHAWTAQLVARVARLLGNVDAETRYRSLAARARDAFKRGYVRPEGLLSSDTAAAYAIALRFGLLDPVEREHAHRRLVRLIELADYTIPTGFLGTPPLADALVDGGAIDAAYRLVLQTACPSWLYTVRMGGTTIWERWDSMLPDGSVNPGQMTSFNHYAFGSIADWLHRRVGGLAPAAPGYRRLLVEPCPGGGLRHASAEHITPFGRAAVSWQREGTSFEVEVTVPPGASATIQLPDRSLAPLEVGSGRHVLDCRFRRVEDDPVVDHVSRIIRA